jgi:hypothetical protein
VTVARPGDAARAAATPPQVPLCDRSLRDRLAALTLADETAEPAARPWRFGVRLTGPYGFGTEDPFGGSTLGTLTRVRARVRLTVEVITKDTDVGWLGGPAARLTGTFRSGALGGPRPLRQGVAVAREAGGPASELLGYELHLTAWEAIPLTVRGHTCMLPRTWSSRLPLARTALSLELWRDATPDGSEPEQLIATGILRLGLLSALRGAAGFYRSAPAGARPGLALARVVAAVHQRSAA